mmetsp:Transcript_12055/g.31538  ORF Transcript_12055/g.31538 Transcript_12055/m.31538 type:complete len:209 (-) Transcript_12055:313-939(-)
MLVACSRNAGTSRATSASPRSAAVCHSLGRVRKCVTCSVRSASYSKTAWVCSCVSVCSSPSSARTCRGTPVRATISAAALTASRSIGSTPISSCTGDITTWKPSAPAWASANRASGSRAVCLSMPAWKPTLTLNRSVAAARMCSCSSCLSSAAGFEPKGPSMIVVTPPAAAARVPAPNPSKACPLASRPGVATWTRTSTTPGEMCTPG